MPKIGDPSPTSTPAPTSPPLGTLTSTLKFTPSSDSNFVGAPFFQGTITRVSIRGDAGIIGAALQSDTKIGRDGYFLALRGLNAAQGNTGEVTPTSTLGYIYNYTPQNLIRVFVPESGSVTLTALTATSVTITFNDLVYVANEGSLSKGKVTVSGTISGPYKSL